MLSPTMARGASTVSSRAMQRRIRTFSSLDAAGGVTNPLSATAGIGEALITTAGGLIASLVLLFPYNILAGRAEE